MIPMLSVLRQVILITGVHVGKAKTNPIVMAYIRIQRSNPLRLPLKKPKRSICVDVKKRVISRTVMAAIPNYKVGLCIRDNK